MKANHENFHVVLSSNTKGNSVCKCISSSPSEKLLGVTLDSELIFEEHINKTCNIVNKQLKALHYIGSHMSFRQTKNAFKGFH